ncbi:MAG: NAD-dependent epimerase/dehydratase family protein [Clostridia bacterium]|nr:NAD-dependent epimerase/dehydratase family protein [Clostridia bacterium]
MNIYNNELYLQDIKDVCNLNLPWEKIEGKSFFITGATGLLGSFLVDVLVEKGCVVYALGRSAERAKNRFSKIWDKIKFIPYDINNPINFDENEKVDYVIHLASNTHPVAYSTDPIGTITTNIIGLKNILDFSAEHNVERCVFASSNEIYGENRGDVELFDENYCGYINCNTLRAGYNESKRCGEALCQAYIKQKDLDVVISRFTRSYGPTILDSDTKALSQFMKNGLNGEDIILKSEGNQYFSYTYIVDAISGFLTIILLGEKGEAYNIADEKSDIRLKDLAKIVADCSNTKVIFDLPNETERQGFSKATKARLDGSKLKALGWEMKYDMESGISRTLKILRENTK